MYDFLNKRYIDETIHPVKKRNEYLAFTKIIDRSKIFQKTIILADRGYGSYKNFAYIEDRNWKCVIRVKDKNSSRILSKINLPKADEVDKKKNCYLLEDKLIK